VVELVTDLDRRTDLSYYGTVAAVIPVFLVALVIEARSRLEAAAQYAASGIAQDEARLRELTDRLERAHGTGTTELGEVEEFAHHAAEVIAAQRQHSRRILPIARKVVRAYVIVAIPGEAACLVALAAGDGSTFMLSLGALSLIAMVLLWMRSLGSKFTPEEIEDESD
jgi:hypothetical protein